MNRPVRVLALVDYYLPGFKGGGPAVSVSRLINRLKDEVEFFVYTRDRDLGDTASYEGIRGDDWTEREGVPIYYARPESVRMKSLQKIIEQVKPDIIYLNSYFSKMTRAALGLRYVGAVVAPTVLIAPRGEFSPGALALKGRKKRLYLAFANLLGLHHNVTWQVSSVHELEHTKAVIRENPHFFIKAPDLLDPSLADSAARPMKVSGAARFAFLSRISPKKNVLGAIEMLAAGIEGDIEFTVYGPVEDAEYWKACQAAAGRLRVLEGGSVTPTQVIETLGQHHFFLFPTLGENFGHVIPEALSAGCPVLVSDQTPWQDLDEHGAGWVLPLDRRDLWQARLQACVDMDSESYEVHAESARAYVRRLAASSRDVDLSRDMLHAALQLTGRRLVNHPVELGRRVHSHKETDGDPVDIPVEKG